MSDDPQRLPRLFWSELEQLKAAAIAAALFRNRLARRITALDTVKAIASSGGIAAWVVWRNLPWVWSGIIAAAQLADALKPVLPWAKMHRSTNELANSLAILFIDAQYDWELIRSGQLDDRRIAQTLRKLQRSRLQAESRCFQEGYDLPTDLATEAAQQARKMLLAQYDEEP